MKKRLSRGHQWRSLSIGRKEGMTKLLSDKETGLSLARYCRHQCRRIDCRSRAGTGNGCHCWRPRLDGSCTSYLGGNLGLSAEIMEGTITDLFIKKRWINLWQKRCYQSCCLCIIVLAISADTAGLNQIIGFFALSGAITIGWHLHAVWESAVFIRFGLYPTALKNLSSPSSSWMMQQFFTVNNIEQFIETEEGQGSKVLNLEPFLNAVDYDRIYESLVSSIMESSFGGMLLMMAARKPWCL